MICMEQTVVRVREKVGMEECVQTVEQAEAELER